MILFLYCCESCLCPLSSELSCFYLQLTTYFLCCISVGELDSGWNPFILPSESVVLENDSNECVVEPRNVLESWEDYYSWRKFSLQSPIAILLQWPLTMYFILCKCLPIDCE